MRKAIVFSINDKYSFALATVLFNIRDKSQEIFNESDIIVYSENVSENNKKLLRKIKNNISFFEIDDLDFVPKEIYTHKDAQGRWGKFIFQKFNCFDLINEYDQILFLDTDILIFDTINDLFDGSYDLAWGSSFRHPKNLFSGAELISDVYPPNGGVILFNKSLRKYSITSKDLYIAYKNVDGSVSLDEQILSYIAYKNKMKIKKLPSIFNEPKLHKIKEAIIFHFVGGKIKITPWDNQFVYIAVPEWRQYYIQWLKIGGIGPINFNNNDFYNLAYTYATLYSTFSYLNIIKNLDIIKNKDIYTDFIYTQLFCRFYINNFPKEIHYELNMIGNEMFKISLHVEKNIYITQKMKAIFNCIYNTIREKYNNIELIRSECYLNIDIIAHKSEVNFILSILTRASLDLLKKHFLDYLHDAGNQFEIENIDSNFNN